MLVFVEGACFSQVLKSLPADWQPPKQQLRPEEEEASSRNFGDYVEKQQIFQVSYVELIGVHHNHLVT